MRRKLKHTPYAASRARSDAPNIRFWVKAVVALVAQNRRMTPTPPRENRKPADRPEREEEKETRVRSCAKGKYSGYEN